MSVVVTAKPAALGETGAAFFQDCGERNDGRAAWLNTGVKAATHPWLAAGRQVRPVAQIVILADTIKGLQALEHGR